MDKKQLGFALARAVRCTQAPIEVVCALPALPLLALAATAVAAAGAVAGGISQMNQASAAADYEKKAAAENARRQSIDAQKQLGRARANYGASGVTMEGSPLDVLEESAQTAELDRLTILQGGKMRADQYKTQGQNALVKGAGSAASTLLGGTLDYFEGQAKMTPTG